MKPNKNIRFYCDNCGSEVPYNAEICPNCKGSFRLVMCPKCEFTAESRHFSRGCPNCGHMAPAMPLEPRLNRRKKKGFQLSNQFYIVMIPVLLMFFIFLAYIYLRI